MLFMLFGLFILENCNKKTCHVNKSCWVVILEDINQGLDTFFIFLKNLIQLRRIEKN